MTREGEEGVPELEDFTWLLFSMAALPAEEK